MKQQVIVQWLNDLERLVVWNDMLAALPFIEQGLHVDRSTARRVWDALCAWNHGAVSHWYETAPPAKKEIPMCTVVNLRLAKYDVYIGRPRAGRSPVECVPGEEGYFGNPHRIGVWCKACRTIHDRPGSIAAFKHYFLARVLADQRFRQAILDLQGKTLGCFCKRPGQDVPCHGDVIREYLLAQEGKAG